MLDIWSGGLQCPGNGLVRWDIAAFSMSHGRLHCWQHQKSSHAAKMYPCPTPSWESPGFVAHPAPSQAWQRTARSRTAGSPGSSPDGPCHLSHTYPGVTRPHIFRIFLSARPAIYHYHQVSSVTMPGGNRVGARLSLFFCR